jgi:hypothetical protein
VIPCGQYIRKPLGVAAVSRQVHLALFLDKRLDLGAMSGR